MHKLQSHTTIIRYRLISCFFLIRIFLSLVALPLAAYGLFTDHRQLVIAGLATVFFAVVVRVLEWSLAGKVRCPLCMTPVMRNMGCSRHRRARRLLGSYRLRVAIGVLFRDRFTCPYCNEPTAIQVRQKRATS